jgi:hypothetical protein
MSAGLAAMAAVLLLLVVLAILFPAFALLRPVLVDAQPALELLDAALLVRRQVPFALLFAQGFEFLLQGIITRPGRIVRISHGRTSMSCRGRQAIPPFCARAEMPDRVNPC